MHSKGTPAPSRGCGTCRARRIRCDRGRPSCVRCTRTGRVCDGLYVFRLSWPRSDDSRRAVVGHAPITWQNELAVRDLQWVSASFRDIELHDYLLHSTPTRIANSATSTASSFGGRRREAPPPILSIPVSWVPLKLDTKEMNLFQYFERVAVSALSVFGQDHTELRDLLIRMSFSDNTSSSNAVLQAILALSSVHWDGHQTQAAVLKIGALKALRTSLGSGDMGWKEAMQHVAAGMILCSLEIQKPTETYGDWLRYGCGVKHVIRAAQLTTNSTDNDSVILLGWAHYHDVLARFSKRHWREGMDVYSPGDNVPLMTATCQNPESPRPSSPPHEILHLLSMVCEAILDPSHPRYHAQDYRQHLSMIESRLKEVAVFETATPSPRTHKDETIALCSELHRLATLVYLERASGNISRESAKVKNWNRKAFRIFSKLETCRWLFPLLIFGSEARSEGQRRFILDVMSKTERETQVRSLECIRTLIKAIWIQDDLSDGDLVYLDKLGAIMSSSDELPVFV